jgi:pyruvate dehydrogenase E2 component (dihydrolipoyllysine-residue acetyltransferase)
VASEIKMPRFGMTMKKGKVAKWFKKEGDKVQKGEPLFEVETEKITNTVQSIASGILFQIVIPAGETVPVGAVLAIVAAEGERPERIEGIKVGEVEDVEVVSAGKAGRLGAQEPAEKGYVLASPAAKRLAKELGVDLARVPGTGKEGRVTEDDVRRFHEEGPPPARITPVAAEMARHAGIDISTLQGTGEGGKITKEDVERALAAPEALRGAAPGAPESIPFTGMRRAIADNMLASLHNAAQLTLMTEVDVTEMVRFRDLLREEYGKDESVRVSYNDIIIYAVARLLKRFPTMNSTLAGEEILAHDRVDIGMAVALHDGLIVPKVRNADKKGILQIGREARELARKAREGGLTPDEVTDGTFTISNMSMLGVDGFTPIINPPEAAILGVGRILEKPGVRNGKIEIRSFMTLSLTIDHRIVDGAPGAEFLQSLARHLEQPALLSAQIG